jgi:hypothetical protein
VAAGPQAGRGRLQLQPPTGYDFALARYNPNGSLDSSFDGTGKVTTAIDSSHDDAYALALQPNGAIDAAGSSYNGSKERLRPRPLPR